MTAWAAIAGNILAALWSSRITRLMLALSWLVLLFGRGRVGDWIEAVGIEGIAALVRGVATFGAELAVPGMLEAPEVGP